MSEERKTNSFTKRLKEEFLFTTDTLWQNEINANLFVAKILLITAAMAVVMLILINMNVFTVNNNIIKGMLIQSIIELLVIAALAFFLKGQKKWLKIVLLVTYLIVLARIEMVLGHNVVIAILFPIILSIRYYSKPITVATGILTVISSFIGTYYAIHNQLIRLDMNMIQLPAGTDLYFETDALLRTAVEASGNIDYHALWLRTLQHSFLPKLFLFSIVIVICGEIAKRGRLMIFDQQAETQKTARLSTELNLANTIQTSMLPTIFPPFPGKDEIEIYASMDPAKEVGGDFYDFYLIDDDHLALVIADVSGKGIPAAMFMMASKIILNNFSLMSDADPSAVLEQVNNRITANNPMEMFVTVWFGVLEISTGKVVASNGGHEYPYIYHKANGKFERFKDRHGLVLGAMENSKYTPYEFQLEPGDALFVYTDGVPEATNANSEQFGEERLEKALNKVVDGSVKEIIETMTNDIADFVQDAPQFDDTTMLVLRYVGPKKN